MDNLEMVSHEGDMFLNEKAFEFAQRVANVFAKSTMVPDHFKGNVGNCLIALNYASRIKADPFMVMQNMFVIHGKPGIEGKLVIALVNQSGRFDPLEFDEGEGYCTAFARDLRSGKDLKGPKISIQMVKAEGWLAKNGSKWQTMPDLMFRYRAATYFARTYCPEVLLGMQTKEELEDIYINTSKNYSGSCSPAESLNAKIKGIESIVVEEILEVAEDKAKAEDLTAKLKKVEPKAKPEEKEVAVVSECPNDDKPKTQEECERCEVKEGCPEHS